jgi:hypothetical protein
VRICRLFCPMIKRIQVTAIAVDGVTTIGYY